MPNLLEYECPECSFRYDVSLHSPYCHVCKDPRVVMDLLSSEKNSDSVDDQLYDTSTDDMSNQSIVALVEALREKSKEQSGLYEDMIARRDELIKEQKGEVESCALALQNISNASFWSRFKYMLSGDISKVRD